MGARSDIPSSRHDLRNGSRITLGAIEVPFIGGEL